MVKAHIVTDSSAHFAYSHFVKQNPITVISNRIDIGGKIYREGVDIDPTDALHLIAQQTVAPTITSPSVADYVEVYTRLSHSCDLIVSIHASREIFKSWHNAHQAAQQLAGHCDILVIDSQQIGAAQGLLVRSAIRVIEQENTLEAIERRIRSAVERVYSVYYVETIDFLMQNKIMDSSHSVLGMMLGIKPFLTIEEGQIVAIEKVRTRAQAVERLYEFAVEFTDVEEALILQHRHHVSEQARMLQDRLTQEFNGRTFPTSIYGTSLAALIGADATGIVILEKELDDVSRI